MSLRCDTVSNMHTCKVQYFLWTQDLAQCPWCNISEKEENSRLASYKFWKLAQKLSSNQLYTLRLFASTFHSFIVPPVYRKSSPYLFLFLNFKPFYYFLLLQSIRLVRLLCVYFRDLNTLPHHNRHINKHKQTTRKQKSSATIYVILILKNDMTNVMDAYLKLNLFYYSR